MPRLTLGYEVAKHAMTYLRQPNGPNAGQAFRPVLSQVRFWLWWYAVDEDGEWLFHRGARRLPKGSGKSPFAGVQGIEEFCGPVRLKDFDPMVKGGCVGRPVDMPLVQIVATAEQQTANTMRMVRAFAPKDSRLCREYGIDWGKTQLFKPPEGTLEQRASSHTSLEGSEATFSVADETEHWKPGNGGPELANTLLDNLAKSGSRMLETCNAWEPGTESVAEATYDAWVAQEEGKTRGKARILYDARIAPPNAVLHDDPADGEVGLTEALKFVYDDCWWAKPGPIRDRIYDVSSSPSDSLRKYFNRPTAAEDAWTTQGEWSLLADPSIVVADDEPIAMFFDGSKSRDATALIGCRMSDGHVFRIGVWEPDPAHNTVDVVPVGAVDSAVEMAFRKYDVVGFFADVQEWESFAKVTWPERYADRLCVWALPGGKEPQRIAWDMRSKSYDFSLACETTLAEIHERQFTHDGDPDVGRHVANARRRPNKFGLISIGKESPSSRKKIDAAVCVIGARMVRRQVLASKEWLERSKPGPPKVGAGYGF